MTRIHAAVLLLLSSCASGGSSATQIPNPASQYCLQVGGKHHVKSNASGQTGYCRLPDGRLVNEWEFYRSAQAAKSSSEDFTPR